MAKKKESAQMGRPQKPFDPNIFEGLCRIQCTTAEICGVMEISRDTLERRVKEIYDSTIAAIFQEKAAAGLVSLRRNQFKMAESNPTMAIWCGKQISDTQIT